MKYIVLLRGVNMMGKNAVPMSELTKELTASGYMNVETFLNSGNVILESRQRATTVSKNVSAVIRRCFGFETTVLVLTVRELKEILKQRPEWWGTEDKSIYDNLIFIIPPATYGDISELLGEPTEELERVFGVCNAVFWSFDRSRYQKAAWWKKTATPPVKNMITVRTANTARKLLKLCGPSVTR